MEVWICAARNQALDIISQAYKMCSNLFAGKSTDAYLYSTYCRRKEDGHEHRTIYP